MFGSTASAFFLIAKFPLLPFPVNLKNLVPTVHVSDLCNAALFLSSRSEAAGEAYIITDDGQITINELIKHGAPLMGVRIVPMFIPAKIFIRMAKGAAEVSSSVAGLAGVRPFIERDMVDFLKGEYRFSNDKIRALGFEFEYPDMMDGIDETIDWYRENGYLDRRELWRKALFGKTRN